MERLTEKVGDRYIERTDKVNGKIVGTKMCLNKLGEYKNAEEKGFLLWLPCKAGDTVYVVVTPNNDMDEIKVEKMKVRSIEIYPAISESIRFWCKREKYVGDWCFYAEDFGEIVFRTKKQTEKALKKMQTNIK